MAVQENKVIERWIDAEDPEPILEPDLPIIDPHHHLWDLRKLNDLGFRQEVYLCEEISKDIATSGHNIKKTVFAQCGAFYRADGVQHMRCVGETEFANGMAAMSRSGVYGNTSICAGIFSTADMRLGTAVQAVLEAHLDASQNFRGIRTALPSELNSNFMDAFGVIEKFGLTYDNWSPDFSRIPILAQLAGRFPSVKVVLHGDVVVFDAERVEEELAELLRRGVEAERRHGVGSMSARRLHDEQGDLDWNTRKPTYLPFTPSGAASGRADLPSYLRASRGLRPRDLPTYLLQVTQ